MAMFSTITFVGLRPRARHIRFPRIERKLAVEFLRLALVRRYIFGANVHDTRDAHPYYL